MLAGTGIAGVVATLWYWGTHFNALLMIASFGVSIHVGVSLASGRQRSGTLGVAFTAWLGLLLLLGYRGLVAGWSLTNPVVVLFAASGILLTAVVITRAAGATWSRSQLTGIGVGVALVLLGIGLNLVRVSSGNSRFLRLTPIVVGGAVIGRSLRGKRDAAPDSE